MGEGVPWPPDLSATQLPGTDEDSSWASTDTARSMQRKFEEPSMPKLGRLDYVMDGLFYCPWGEWRRDAKEKCHDTFSSNRDRNKHLKTHVKPIPCPYTGCPLSTAERKEMKRHVETHKPRASRPLFSCPDCGKMFTRVDNIPRHQESAHGVGAQT